MTASSYYTVRPGFSSYYGRLNETRGSSWCAQDCCGSYDWLQVDLGKTTEICGVATQGHNVSYINIPAWVMDFKLSYSSNGSGWATYSANGSEVVRPDLLMVIGLSGVQSDLCYY